MSTRTKDDWFLDCATCAYRPKEGSKSHLCSHEYRKHCGPCYNFSAPVPTGWASKTDLRNYVKR